MPRHFLKMKPCRGDFPFRIGLIGARSPKRTMSCIHGLPTGTAAGDAAEKISIIGIDITDDVSNIQTLCQYLLKNHDFTGADTQTQGLLTAIREQNPFSSLQLQTFQEKFLPQLAELYQTKPKQLETVLGTQTVYLERALLGWEEAQEQQRLKGETEQLGGPGDVYRENCLYEHFMWEYQQRPDAKYYGQFGGAHVLMSDYSGKLYRVQNSFVTRLAETDTPLNGKLTVIDGCLTFEIGDLGKSDVNKATLYNTTRAGPPIHKMNKFYMNSSAPDVSYAQYVLLFEHPDALTAAKEYTGSYWKYH